LYATGCGVIAALGFYHVTQPAAIRVAPGASQSAVVWLTILGAFASPIFLPLTAALVKGSGWRDTLRVLAAIAATVFLATAASGRGGRRIDHSAVRRTTVPNALRDAWGVPGFPRWVLASLISGAAVDVILVYQVPVMIAAGLPIGAAATIGGIRGFAQLAGRIPLSPLLRRLGARQTIVVSFLAGGIGTLFLLASGHVAPAIAYSLLAGASIGAMYTLQGIYTNELVGQENLSLLMGAQGAVFAVGGAIGPVLAGTVFAATNSYVAVVLLTAAGLLASAVIMSTSGLTGVPRQPRPNAAARPPGPFGWARSAVERGDRGRVELLDELVHATGDVVAGGADLIDRPALGIGQLPIDVTLAGDERAGVAAPHRHHHVSPLSQFV
jgi:predicted MFS family arabinose efflux permease